MTPLTGFLEKAKYGRSPFTCFPPLFSTTVFAALAKFTKLNSEGPPVQPAEIHHGGYSFLSRDQTLGLHGPPPPANKPLCLQRLPAGCPTWGGCFPRGYVQEGRVRMKSEIRTLDAGRRVKPPEGLPFLRQQILKTLRKGTLVPPCLCY